MATSSTDALERVRTLRSVSNTLEGELWEAVVAARNEAGCSLRAVAEAAGISPTHLQRKLNEGRRSHGSA